MKLGELLSGIDILQTDIENFDIEISGIGDDCDEVGENEIFVALRGVHHDGHKYISSAVKNGVAVILCERKPVNLKAHFVRVKSTRSAYAVVWNNFCGCPCERLKFIGVTGTNGKTTTVKLIEHILDTAGFQVQSIGTLNAPLTTPDPPVLYPMLADMVNNGIEYAVMEVSSHSLYFDKLYPIKFKIGIFTNLSSEHLDFHKNMYDYAKAKAKLFGKSEICVYNLDDKFSQSVCKDAGYKLSYAIDDPGADYTAESIGLDFENISFTVMGKGRTAELKVPLVGRFNVYNIMAAYIGAKCLGIDSEIIKNALSTLPKINGRLDRVETNDGRRIFIDYAHTPDAVAKVLSSLRECSKEGQKITVVFGCGGDRDKSKRPMMGKIATELADYCIITSDNSRSEDPYSIIKDIVKGIEKKNYLIIAERRSAIEYAVRRSSGNDVLVFLGKGHEKYEINIMGKIPFDERAVIENALE